MYILSCLGQPTRGVIGYVDAARVGPDSHPAHFAHCLESVLRFQIYNRVWWNNDADVSYLDVKLPSRRVGHTPGRSRHVERPGTTQWLLPGAPR